MYNATVARSARDVITGPGAGCRVPARFLTRSCLPPAGGEYHDAHAKEVIVDTWIIVVVGVLAASTVGLLRLCMALGRAP
jgi:hypothetical protein